MVRMLQAVSRRRGEPGSYRAVIVGGCYTGLDGRKNNKPVTRKSTARTQMGLARKVGKSKYKNRTT